MNLKCVIIFVALCGLLLASVGCLSVGHWSVERPIELQQRSASPVKDRVVLGVGNKVVTLSFEDWQRPDKFAASPSQDRLRKVPAAVAAWVNDGTVSSELSFASSGAWAIYIPSAGRYRLTLRILPADSDIQVRLRPGRAHLNCGNIAAEKTIEPGAFFVEFVLELDSGSQNLQAYFTNQLPNRRTVGAFYVDARHLPN